jgi:hypothetical protein
MKLSNGKCMFPKKLTATKIKKQVTKTVDDPARDFEVLEKMLYLLLLPNLIPIRAANPSAKPTHKSATVNTVCAGWNIANTNMPIGKNTSPNVLLFT